MQFLSCGIRNDRLNLLECLQVNVCRVSVVCPRSLEIAIGFQLPLLPLQSHCLAILNSLCLEVFHLGRRITDEWIVLMIASKHLWRISSLSRAFWSFQLLQLDCYNQFHVFRSISFRSENYRLYLAKRFRGLNQSYQQQCRSTEVGIIAGKSWSSFNGRYIQAQTKERTKHEEKPPDNGMFNITPSFCKKKK